MLPDVVTFWDGPLDRLRRLCLRSQLAAGHRVTLYSFAPIADLPDGVVNAPAETILPRTFAEKLRPSAADGRWTGWTPVQFSDFFRMALMAQGLRQGSKQGAGRDLGLWLDADVLLKAPVTFDAAKPFFAWESRDQIGNSVLYLPGDHVIVAAFAGLMRQDELRPSWLSARYRATFALRKLAGKSHRIADLRVALYGPPALTALARQSGDLQHALPKRSFYAVHAEPRLFFDPSQEVTALIDDPGVVGFHISPKTRKDDAPMDGSLYAWAAERFGG